VTPSIRYRIQSELDFESKFGHRKSAAELEFEKYSNTGQVLSILNVLLDFDQAGSVGQAGPGLSSPSDHQDG
jgi:hypothetical protein